MGIRVTGKTKAPNAMKLYSKIASFLFEEEFGELKYHQAAKKALENANKELAKVFNNS